MRSDVLLEFTGSARQAAKLHGTRCLWPGCGRPRTHIDHTRDWQFDGVTDPANAGPICARHDRHKNHGYTVWRDEHGRWHTHRPDGTEIEAASTRRADQPSSAGCPG